MRYGYAVQRVLDRQTYLKREDLIQRFRYSTFDDVATQYMYFGVIIPSSVKW